MPSSINFDAKNLVQSQSPKAPFNVVFEFDNDLAVVYAIANNVEHPSIVDQVVLTAYQPDADIIVRWNSTGDRAALLINERITVVFDFSKHTTFTEQMIPTIETSWFRQILTFSSSLAVEFGIDQFFKQPELDRAIEHLKTDESQTNRLLFYKILLTSKLFVPITTQSPEDPNALIYTFPNHLVENVDHSGNLICTFTNSETFNEQMGQHGLSFQKISADFLCFQAQSFDDILGITVTSTSGHTVLITRNEFQLLALISQPQRLDTQTLLKELGNVFFDDQFDSQRDQVIQFCANDLVQKQLVRSAYYCQPSVDGASPIFCLVLKSTSASEALNELVYHLKSSELQSFCEFHLFSLSDIVAQALEQSKQPVYQPT